MTQQPELNTFSAGKADMSSYTRRNRIKPPTGIVGKSLIAAKDWLENRIARASLHGDPPIYNPRDFPWVAGLEAEWQSVRTELDRVMKRRDEIPSFHEIMSQVETITRDDQWKTFFLAGIGMDCRQNSSRCPDTMRLLQRIPGMKTAFFSILSPHKHIPPHRGPYAGVLRLHLGLLVPEPREKCRIRIANQFRHWEEGKVLIFDDTYNHEVWNDTAGYRVVLFVDFARPLRRPLNRINQSVLDMAALAPFIREAQGKHQKWERRFYKS